jgi:hypothetical protein
MFLVFAREIVLQHPQPGGDISTSARRRREGRLPWTLIGVPVGRGCGAKEPVGRDPAADRRFAAGFFAAMTGLGQETCRSPERRATPSERRGAPSQHEMITAPAVKSPYQPHRTRRSLCNVPISAGFAIDSRSCHHFPQVEGVTRRKRIARRAVPSHDQLAVGCPYGKSRRKASRNVLFPATRLGYMLCPSGLTLIPQGVNLNIRLNKVE